MKETMLEKVCSSSWIPICSFKGFNLKINLEAKLQTDHLVGFSKTRLFVHIYSTHSFINLSFFRH
jgi:hypothetical protein